MPELTIENAADQVNAAIATLHDSPAEEKEGRGIVIAAGGVKFQINAWVCIRMLRDLGCQLPIQCWYLGDPERNRAWEQIVASYGVEWNQYTVRLSNGSSSRTLCGFEPLESSPWRCAQ